MFVFWDTGCVVANSVQPSERFAGLKVVHDMLLQFIPPGLIVIYLLSIVLLMQGQKAIVMGNWFRHRNLMLPAIVLAAAGIFLTIVYFALTATPSFGGGGLAAGFGWTVLILHAAAMSGFIVLLPWTLYRIARHLVIPHKIMARWTIRIWLFMAVSGTLFNAFISYLTFAL